MSALGIRRAWVAVMLAGVGVWLGQGGPGGGTGAVGRAGAGSPVSATKAEASTAALGELRVTLMDGSIVAGKLSVPDISIETKYGSLKVPVDQIKSFAPGLQSHPAFSQSLDSLVNDLAADAFPDREKAQQALLQMGPQIIGELQMQFKAVGDEERKNRLQKILDELESTRDEDADTSHDWVREDFIVTPGFKIVGRITTTTFAMNTSYGVLQLKLADVRKARRDSHDLEDIRKTLSVSGNTITQHSYTQGIRVNKGDQIMITASGTIKMTPWGGNAQSTPEGVANYGVMQPGNFPSGCLIGRIGPGGTLFKVGEKVAFTADRNGQMEFGIAMPGDYSSNQFPGEYELKIHVVPVPSKD